MGGGSPTSRSTGRSTPRPSELSRAFIALGGGAVVIFVASFESVHDRVAIVLDDHDLGSVLLVIAGSEARQRSSSCSHRDFRTLRFR